LTLREAEVREVRFEEQCAMTAGSAMWASVAVEDAGIPAFMMGDGPMGIASGRVDERDVARLSPCATALGASWDVDLLRRVGSLIGDEAAARGIDAVLAPNINLARSPLAGRAFEYFSEDPLLAGTLGAAWIDGLQSTGTGAIAKHLVCNDSETDRDRVDVRIDERTLREVYLLPFELAAEAGCVGMLTAYNKVNGHWCAEQHHVMSEIVKGEWKYPGLIMSDWFGTHSTVATIGAGLDLEMPGPARFLGAKVQDAVDDGSIARERVIDAARRVARTAQRITGAKRQPGTREEADALLVEAAAAGFVLLRNERGMLPLAPGTVARIAVIGPNAAAPCFQGGTFAKIAVDPNIPSPIDAIRARYEGATEIVFEPGVDPQPRLPSMPVRPALDIGDGCSSGMTLEYFATEDWSGEPVSRETRATNSLVWFVGVHEQAHFDQGGSIRASGVFTAERTGEHRFYLGATGEADLAIDGEPVVRTRQRPAADVMGALKAGDAETATCSLEAGQEVRVEVRFRFVPARVQGLWYGVRSPDSSEAMLARAVEAARSADAVFLIVGETSDSSVESKDRPDTRLPMEQIDLIEKVTQANPRTAIVANVGHAFDCGWEERADALLAAWYPGEGFAHALADVLAGDREPGGRMPVSIARNEDDYCGYALQPDTEGRLAYAEGTRFGYRGLIAKRVPARHAFGSGMGYVAFEWTEAHADHLTLSIIVHNRSGRAGSDVVQVYRDEPECTLIAFAKVHLEARESRRIQIALSPRRFVTWHDGAWARIAETVRVRIARSAESAGLPLSIEVAPAIGLNAPEGVQAG
jgi:beta-glucosidase